MDNQLTHFKITDRQSFIKFLKLLQEDLYENPDKWQNIRLDNFLEAMTRYTEDIQGYYNNSRQNINADLPSWQLFADILKGAVIYD